MGRFPSRKDGITQVPISPGRSSHYSGMEERRRLLTPFCPGTLESTRFQHRHLCFAVCFQGDLTHNIQRFGEAIFMLMRADLSVLYLGKKAFETYHVIRESPAEVMVLQETCRRCGWCQGSSTVESSFIDFVLSPDVQLRDLDLLIFFNPAFFGLLCTRQSPRTHGRSMMPWSHESPFPRPPVAAGRLADTGDSSLLPLGAWQTSAQQSC